MRLLLFILNRKIAVEDNYHFVLNFFLFRKIKVNEVINKSSRGAPRLLFRTI